jgi:ribosomal-protein-alanine N-acetyltransferase
MPYSIHATTCGAEIAMLTETKFSLRQFNTKDLESVIEINRTCLPENYASFFFIDTFQNCPNAFRVAEVGTQMVGYIMCRVEHGFSDVKRLKFVRKGHIISIAVMPEFRRAGVASELVKQALNALQEMKADECYLEVRETNETAIKLYEKLGFSLARRVPHYYADGAEALVMVAPLEADARSSRNAQA